jgi:hypothetical protein
MNINQSFMTEKFKRCEIWAKFISARPLCYEQNWCAERTKKLWKNKDKIAILKNKLSQFIPNCHDLWFISNINPEFRPEFLCESGKRSSGRIWKFRDNLKIKDNIKSKCNKHHPRIKTALE